MFLGTRAWQLKLKHTGEICVVGKKCFDALEDMLPSGKPRCKLGVKMAGCEFGMRK